MAVDRAQNGDLITSMNRKLDAVVKAEIGVDDGRELPNIRGSPGRSIGSVEPHIPNNGDLQRASRCDHAHSNGRNRGNPCHSDIRSRTTIWVPRRNSVRADSFRVTPRAKALDGHTRECPSGSAR